jgi:hypothetical protein
MLVHRAYNCVPRISVVTGNSWPCTQLACFVSSSQTYVFFHAMFETSAEIFSQVTETCISKCVVCYFACIPGLEAGVLHL